MPTLLDELITVNGFTIPEKEFLRKVALEICRNFCGDEDAFERPAVILYRTAYPIQYYPAATNTNVGRMGALQAALVAANLTPNARALIYLVQGNFGIEAGVPMATFAPAILATGNLHVIHNGVDSALIYALPADAGSDHSFFIGPRNVLNFGATPTTVASSSNAFDSARYSLRPFGLGDAYSEAAPGLGSGAGNLLLRTGTILVPQGDYLLSRPFYIQGSQSFIGDGGRVALYWAAGIAPTVLTPAFGVLRSIQGGNPQANFTHNVIVQGMIFARIPTNNAFLYAALMHTAQCSKFSEMGISNFAGGVIFGQYSNYCQIENVDIAGTDGKTPALQFVQCNMMSGSNISVASHNPFGLELDLQGDAQAAIRFDGCYTSQFTGILVESAPVALNAYGSYGLIFDTVEHLNIDSVANAGLVAAVGTVTIDLHNCANIEVAALRHKFVESVVSQDNVIIHAGEGAALGAASLLPFDYTSDKRIRTVNAFRTKFSGVGSGAVYERVDATPTPRQFTVLTNQAAGNPSWTLTSSALDGSGAVEQINIAHNNGGALTGYSLVVQNLYSYGNINTLTGYAIDGVQVLTNRETGWGPLVGTGSKVTFATYNVPVISAAYVQAEVQAIADHVQALSQRMKSYDNLLLAHGLIGP